MKGGKWLDPVPFRQVEIHDTFWAPRQHTNQTVTLPAIHRELTKTGRIRAFDLTWKPGKPGKPHVFWDSDVAKWVEAACNTLEKGSPSKNLRTVERVVTRIIGAQQRKGYLNTYFTVVEPRKRWTNLRDQHELYCAGHLMEAAVAHFEATGSRRFLDVMCRFADHIDKVFGRGRGKRRGYPGHPEIELALIRLYRVTGERRYLRLAGFFLDERGRPPCYFDTEAKARKEDPGAYRYGTMEYLQAHQPLVKQGEAVGHAVRALYLYTAMADLVRETGDTAMTGPLEKLWKSAVLRKMYITGGVGSSGANEGFTRDYDLPVEGAYAETCAAVAMVLFNHRMLQHRGDGRFGDVMERALYNGVISGVSLEGDRFFYANPMVRYETASEEVDEGRSIWDGVTYSRRSWFGCACCPGNLARLLASVGGCFYSTDPEGLWVHLYGSSTTRASLKGGTVYLRQETGYPWEGRIRIFLHPRRTMAFDLNLRIPGWCKTAQLKVAGRALAISPLLKKGYARIKRRWNPGDPVELNLSMPVERVTAHPMVRQVLGRSVLQRGPLVYCLEQKDNPHVPLDRIALPQKALFKSVFKKRLLGGVAVVEGQGVLIDRKGWGGVLYRPGPNRTHRVKFTAVPYCVWDNRGGGAMRLWLRSI